MQPLEFEDYNLQTNNNISLGVTQPFDDCVSSGAADSTNSSPSNRVWLIILLVLLISFQLVSVVLEVVWVHLQLRVFLVIL